MATLSSFETVLHAKKEGAEKDPLMASSIPFLKHAEHIYGSCTVPFRIMYFLAVTSSIIYLATGLGDNLSKSDDDGENGTGGVLFNILDYSFMFLLGLTLITDGFFSAYILNCSGNFSHRAKMIILMKIIVFITINAYYAFSSYSKDFWLNFFHSVATAIMFSLCAVFQELILIQLYEFENTLQPIDKYHDDFICDDYVDSNVYQKIQSNKKNLQFFCRVNSILLSGLILFSLIISFVEIVEARTWLGNGIQNAVYYISHFFMVFLSIEGTMRRVSYYNNLISKISTLLRYKTKLYVTVFGIKPVGFLLFSYYLSLLLFILKYVYDI
jgi:hypothetical protein